MTALQKIVSKEREPNGFREPRRWQNSTVFRLLERDIRDGVVHSAPTNPSDWETIYIMRPEYSLFDNKKFEKRLETLRNKAGESNSWSQEDESRFEAFLARHEVSLFSHNGYEQWQGSNAQQLLILCLENNKLVTMRKQDLYGSRSEYYDHFPLKNFRDFLDQEVGTAKWRHTLEVKGKQFKAS